MTLSNFVSLQWWISVGIATVLLSIFQDLVRRALYALLGATSTAWRIRNAAAKSAFEARARELAIYPHLYEAAGKQEMRLRSECTHFLLTGITLLVMASMFLVAQAGGRVAAAFDWPFQHNDSSKYPLVFSVLAVLMVLFATSKLSKAKKQQVLLESADVIRAPSLTVQDPVATKG